VGFPIIFLLICDGAFKLSALLLYTVVNKGEKKCPTERMQGQNARRRSRGVASFRFNNGATSLVLSRVSLSGLGSRDTWGVLRAGGKTQARTASRCRLLSLSRIARNEDNLKGGFLNPLRPEPPSWEVALR
jgi:hypothetical protein